MLEQISIINIRIFMPNIPVPVPVLHMLMFVLPPLLPDLFNLFSICLNTLLNRPITFLNKISLQQQPQQTRFVLQPPRLILREPQQRAQQLREQQLREQQQRDSQQQREPQIDPRRQFERQNDEDNRREQLREDDQRRQRESRLEKQHRRRNYE